MSGYPLVLRGDTIRALIVGGGRVAARKATALLDAGASVTVVAPELGSDTKAIIDAGRATWLQQQYDPSNIRDANLVFAATDSVEVNAAVARDARARGVLINVASDGDSGDFYTPATHREGEIVVSVFAGGLPAAAQRVRDAIAPIIDARVASAVARLARLRDERLASGDSESWAKASREIIGDDFLASVANGEFERRLERWG